MIVFDLECRAGGHRFEGWFGSSEDFTRQQERGLVSCPECASSDVHKAPMAPHLARKGNQLAVPSMAAKMPGAAPAAASVPEVTTPPAGPPPMTLPPEAAAMMMAYARMQAEALKASRWVGDKFADDARAMHYGEKDHAPIHGQASLQDARDLLEEGIEVAPILFPLVPPGNVN